MGNPSNQSVADVREAILSYDPDTEFHYQHVFANAFPIDGRTYHETTISAVLKQLSQEGEITRVRPGVYMRQPCEPVAKLPKGDEPKKITLTIVYKRGDRTFAVDQAGDLHVVTKVKV